ncbi:TPA: hypothetical protein ACMD0O_002159 [Vibrio parahaemolyticus]|uniref:hypothetical protein n=1 Tax=Vibrio parahaemolyticus TaxID=670 RepID=UPI0007620369|nr:hypothetical protein [Vibrio parahaemolyticus]KWU35324.1 hypothetical protein AVL51_00440 [Vibrio parahaemolyticus]HCG6518873.1 hypothetical protein [Vibrio parahaemolyticus]HCM1019913.1 hypothetical protein [Vibrio parahaemolyticus]HCM1046831.1 hypothetical protein [Vibrio parahaemolyticus]HCM1052249.1 hypothetical protein [Vibrio parahaemolyticus]
MEIKEMLLTSLKVLMIASIVIVAFAGGDLFEMFRDGILQKHGFAIPINGFMFQVAAILCLVAVYPVDLMRDKEVQGFKRFAIMSIKSILLIFSLVNLILIVNTLLNFELVMLQVIFFSAAIFSFVFSYKMLISVSNDSNDSQILSNINGIQALCLTTIVSLIAYQGTIYSPIIFSVLFACSLIFTACIAIYHSRIRWNQQNGIKEIA